MSDDLRQDFLEALHRELGALVRPPWECIATITPRGLINRLLVQQPGRTNYLSIHFGLDRLIVERPATADYDSYELTDPECLDRIKEQVCAWTRG